MRSSQEFRDVLDLVQRLAALPIPAVLKNAALVSLKDDFCNRTQHGPYREIVTALPDFEEPAADGAAEDHEAVEPPRGDPPAPKRTPPARGGRPPAKK